jgi:hypothetical protein
VREHPAPESWGHLAPSGQEALQHFAKVLGVQLEICISPGSYHLEKYVASPGGRVLEDDILRVA